VKVESASKDIKAVLVVLTGTGSLGSDKVHTWIFGEPGKDGLRLVYFDGESKGEGVLLGSVNSVSTSYNPSGYETVSLDIKVGLSLGVKFSNRPKSKRIENSPPVTVITVMAKKGSCGKKPREERSE
jgi:hypothetical protein